MGLRRVIAFLLLGVAGTASSARAQYTIDSVVFSRAEPYTEAELLATSGLAAGQFLAHDSLANAAQHLLDTGLFADAQVSLSGQGKERTVHVDLKPVPLGDLLPASFENLVWFTPEELAQGVHARIPLYRGGAAEAGNMPDAIQTALQQMLVEKGVTAKLVHDVVAPTVQHPTRVVNYRVDQPVVRLVDVHLSIAGPTGVAAQLAPGVQASANRAPKLPFNEGLTGVTIADALLPAARNKGYITAHLDNISRTFATTEHGVGVTYAARIVTGESYKVSMITWAPTAVYSAADFNRDAKLHPGDAGNIYALNETNRFIAAAYTARGYMDVVVLAPPSLDETAHTVAYTITVKPGEVYRLRSVTPVNLSPEARAEFESAWKMKPGDPYDESYIPGFIQGHETLTHLAKYVASYQASADPVTHLVDLTLTFSLR